jgi:hypothetical protein
VNLFLHLAVSFPSHHVCDFKQCSYSVLIGEFEPYSGFLSHKHGDLFQVVILFIIQLSMNICTRPAGR